MSDLGWSRHIASQEEAAESACGGAAAAQGLSADQAEACDDGELGCAGCPWKKDKPAAQLAHLADMDRDDGEGSSVESDATQTLSRHSAVTERSHG